MSDLFSREVFLNVGGTVIRTKLSEGEQAPILKMSFKIVRSRTKEPNSADITILNLKKDNRVKFQQKNIPTVLKAGYSGSTSIIFSGDLTVSQSKWNGEDWVTTMQAGDGNKEYTSKRINLSLAGPIQLGDVLKNAADAMGLGLGNVQAAIDKGAVRGKISEFTNGVVLSGKAEKELGKILETMGYTFSIQDGQIEVLEENETISPAGEEAVVLSSGTGMIGSPEAGEDGFVKVRALIQPDLIPGRKMKIESKNKPVSGFFKIMKSTFIGDTWGNDWYVDIEGKPL